MAESKPEILNLAGYLFVELDKDHLEQVRYQLRDVAKKLNIKGSILLSTEGLNCFYAGFEPDVRAFQVEFAKFIPEAKKIDYREHYSHVRPFSRVLIKIKPEIIRMACPEVDPVVETVPHLSPEDLAAWYAAGKDMLVLDTRNIYETDLGLFKDALDLRIDKFTDFPEAVTKAVPKDINKPIVMYCTGGVRCEKAGEYMRQQGYKDIYQLDRGILGYFEKVGSDNYEGDCFVFDKRVGVKTDLSESFAQQCFACRRPMSPEEYGEQHGVCGCGSQVLPPGVAKLSQRECEAQK